MFENTSIRNKLVLSNMLMIFVPVVIIIAVVFLISTLLTYSSNSYFSMDPTFGAFLLYKTQFNAAKIELSLADAARGEESVLGKIDRERSEVLQYGITASSSGIEKFITDSVLLECDTIQSDGADIMILANNEIIYKTQSADVYKMVGDVFDISSKSLSDITQSFVTSGYRGTVIADVFELDDASEIKIIIVNENLKAVVSSSTGDVVGDMPVRGDNILIVVILISVIAIIGTNGIMVIFVIKGIMGPLNKLRRATHELRDGNLDYKIDYRSKNEIGQVCADFDEMRLRLKGSVEQQQRYEENRMELVAGISHDLGTPLTTIKGYASGLIDGIADTQEKREKYLRIIYNTAGDMDRLVSELSMLSKLSLDRIPFYFEKANVRSFFDECAEDIRNTLEADGIVFRYSCTCSEDRQASIDRDQFKRVVNNLVDNCKKYKNPSAKKNRAALTVSDNEAGGVDIVFEDNGVGLADGEYEKIFDSFYRSDKARSNVKSGSGLGLAITKQIVERHNASISASRSSLGSRGLAIKISLPQPKTHEKG